MPLLRELQWEELKGIRRMRSRSDTTGWTPVGEVGSVVRWGGVGIVGKGIRGSNDTQ